VVTLNSVSSTSIRGNVSEKVLVYGRPIYVIGQAIYIFFLWFLYGPLVCDITIFVLKRDVKLQLTNVSMVALCNRADHYIFALWFLSFFFLSSFFPRLISAVGDWMYTILPHMMWP